LENKSSIAEKYKEYARIAAKESKKMVDAFTCNASAASITSVSNA
jgi:hypothetical protein